MTARATGTRRAVLDDIDEALRLAINGVGPKTLVVTAGPGSGKTHSLHAMVESVDVSTRWATAHDLSWRQPYAVAADLIGTTVPPVIPAEYESRLDSVVDSLCAEEPRLLVVDDAHNADSGSLEFLGRLAASARDLPLVVLVARRHLPTRELLTRLIARPGVREWSLPAMDDADLQVLAHLTLEAWPDDTLTGLLRRSGGNPMHALTVLDALRVRGEIVVADGVASARTDHVGALAASLHDAVREQLSLVDEASRSLVHTLAVWGGPATLDDLAAVGATVPAALVAPTHTVVDAGIVSLSGSGVLSFTHDVFSDVAYDQLAPPLRVVLHTAIAEHHGTQGNQQMRAHHLMTAGSVDAVDALPRAQAELEHAPAVAVDLLESAAGALSDRSLELDLAVALARSGQLSRSADIAAQGLGKTDDISVIARLHRTLLFTLIAQGKTQPVFDLIDRTLELPIDEPTRNTLVDLRRYVALLQGVSPITPRATDIPADAPASNLATEGLYRFLSGDHAGGLAFALDASRREGESGARDDIASSSVDIWPSLIEQFLHGPVAAQALLERGTQLRRTRGSDWLTAYQEFGRGGIEVALGRLDDAIASLDNGLERAQSAGMGWTSLAEASRAVIDVFRGDVVAATQRLDIFDESGAPEQFGMPQCGMARAVLLETQRKLKPAAAQSYTCWTHAESLGIHAWFPSSAIDCARIAVRAGDSRFTDAIATTLGRLPQPLPPAGARSVELAEALCTDSNHVAEIALRCAHDAHAIGDVVTEAAAWEEAACAAAGSGDISSARDHAHVALVLTQGMRATALSSRITSRLRALGLRLDPRVVRDRPRTGWDSLTRTELAIADMVANGRSGTEIANSLFISQRTVQTHISHALTKLGLRTRVELAAQMVGRRTEGSPHGRTTGTDSYVS